MTKMIAAAEFKAACREMLDALGDGPLDADALRLQFEALVDAAPEQAAYGGGDPLFGAMRGSIVWLSDDHVGPVDPDWEAEWDANNPPELYR